MIHMLHSLRQLFAPWYRTDECRQSGHRWAHGRLDRRCERCDKEETFTERGRWE